MPSRLTRRLLRIAARRLAGLAEVAELFGVTKKTAMKYATRGDFPEPVDRLAAGPVWSYSEVKRWGTKHLPLPPGRPRQERSSYRASPDVPPIREPTREAAPPRLERNTTYRDVRERRDRLQKMVRTHVEERERERE